MQTANKSVCNSNIIQSINYSVDRIQLSYKSTSHKIGPLIDTTKLDGNWDPVVDNCASSNAKVVNYMEEYIDRVIIDDVNSFGEAKYNCRICLSSD